MANIKPIIDLPAKGTKVFFYNTHEDSICELKFNERTICSNLLRLGMLWETAHHARIYRHTLLQRGKMLQLHGVQVSDMSA